MIMGSRWMVAKLEVPSGKLLVDQCFEQSCTVWQLPHMRYNSPGTRDWDLGLPRLRTVPAGLGCVRGSSS
jgi:hypothetical protein